MGYKKQGFSLIEVLIALMMVAMTLTSLLSLQSALQKMLLNDSLYWKAEQYAYTLFAEYEKKDNISLGYSSEHEQDGFKALYRFSAIKENDQLAKMKDLYAEQITVSWSRLFYSTSILFIRYVYRPSEKDEASNAVLSDRQIDTPKVGL